MSEIEPRRILWTEGNWVAEGPDMFGDYTIGPVDDLAVAAVISNLRPPEIVAGNARLITAAQDLYEALDPDTLDAIADEIGGEFVHSARAGSLRGIAKRQRVALLKARGA